MTAPRGLGSLFQDPVFLRVWLIGVASGVARWLEMLVVGIYAFEVTGSPFLVAFLVILRMIPLAVFGSVVGAFADRWSRRLVLAVGLGLAALMSGILAVLFWAGAAVYWHVALATFLSGVIWTTDMPFRRGILGDVAGTARIGAAMSLDSASSNANRMLGPLLGGAIYQAFGTGGAFALSMLLYGLAAAVMLTVPAAVSVRVRTGPPTRVRRDLADAFRFAAGSGDVLRVLLVTVVFNLWAFPFVSMIPVIGRAELGLSAAGIGVLTALEGGGALLGALIIAVWGRPRLFRQYYFFGVLAYLLFVIIAGWMPGAVSTGALLTCIGFAGAGFATMQSTLIYSLAPPEMRGRLFGLMVICIGTGLIGFANIGLMGELFGGSMAIRIVAAEGLIPLVLIGLGWRQLWRSG